MLENIIHTIKQLNWEYGYGDVLGVVMDEDWKGGTVTVKRYSCEPNTRRLRFDPATHTVYFAGHQKIALKETAEDIVRKHGPDDIGERLDHGDVEATARYLAAWCDSLRGRQRSGYRVGRQRLIAAGTKVYDGLVARRVELIGE